MNDCWLTILFWWKKIATVRRSHILQEINWSYFVADSIGILTTAMGKGTDLGVLRVVDRCGNLCQQTHRNIITYMQLSPGNALKSWLYFTNRSVYAVLVSKPSLKTLQHLNWLKSIFFGEICESCFGDIDIPKKVLVAITIFHFQLVEISIWEIRWTTVARSNGLLGVYDDDCIWLHDFISIGGAPKYWVVSLVYVGLCSPHENSLNISTITRHRSVWIMFTPCRTAFFFSIFKWWVVLPDWTTWFIGFPLVWICAHDFHSNLALDKWTSCIV